MDLGLWIEDTEREGGCLRVGDGVGGRLNGGEGERDAEDETDAEEAGRS